MAGPGREKTTTLTYRRILWPTDFSPVANAALRHATDLAVECGAELVVHHVLTPPLAYAGPEIPGALWGELQRRNRATAKEELRRVAEKVRGPRLHVHTVLTEGVPFDQILRVAKRLRCDLIVLATHGRTGFSHAIMGSVAENVVRRASCPVLTVRPPKFQS